jgi:hypothetical protein
MANKKEKKKDQLYHPKAPERKTAAKLGIEQYLRQAALRPGIAGLVRSFYATRVMSLAEWDSTVKSLTKRQVK